MKVVINTTMIICFHFLTQNFNNIKLLKILLALCIHPTLYKPLIFYTLCFIILLPLPGQPCSNPFHNLIPLLRDSYPPPPPRRAQFAFTSSRKPFLSLFWCCASGDPLTMTCLCLCLSSSLYWKFHEV